MLINTVAASFDTVVRQMTEMFQRKKGSGINQSLSQPQPVNHSVKILRKYFNIEVALTNSWLSIQ